MDDLESFLLDQGENIVDLMGGEIDRIEMNLRVSANELNLIFTKIIINHFIFADSFPRDSSCRS